MSVRSARSDRIGVWKELCTSGASITVAFFQLEVLNDRRSILFVYFNSVAALIPCCARVSRPRTGNRPKVSSAPRHDTP